ncbi:hypothetical protein GF382_01780, partial [Candidatus Falkowbacteria bacterium]|nr:hypothetical protein [Candidatus Falkowbacteria bacterium]
IFSVVGFVLFSNMTMSSDQADSIFYKIPFIGHIKQLVESSDKDLKGEDNDRINILLLGMGGKKHQGGYLTDTIMLASLKVSEKKVSLLSIPRDLSIPVESGNWTKINNINAFAEFKEEDSGGIAISQALSDLLEIPIDYYVRVDFQGFVNIVDELGGLEVEVENTLSDPSYPIMGQEDNPDYEARFEHLYVEKGIQEMDGELALKFARSRHAAGIEGSDFARAKRQQKIITAAKEKLLSTNYLLKPQILTGIIGELKEHLSTNLKIWEMIKIWKDFKDVEKESISTKVLDNSANGLLYNTINEQGAYVLLPKNGDFEEIKYLVHNIFEDAPLEKKQEVKVENSTLEIRNGTWINGLASRQAVDLEKYGFDVIRIGNSSLKNFEKSIIYDLTFGEKINSLKVLKEKTGASVSFEVPEWLKQDIEKDLNDEQAPQKPDFILIIGRDADSTQSGMENPER